ncbi:MAG TPA: hypothetical protein VFW87_14540 [Pirellulales bacterium]|nr:hypothetical protein [Pirellulales bacterium]
MNRLTCFLALALTLAAARSAFAVVAASGGGGPITTTSYNGNRNDPFVIVADVAYDPGAGQWQKELVNTGSGSMLPSGQPAAIDETLTNVGTVTWTDWHERVVSLTDVGSGLNYPGFLFLSGSLNVYRNGGLLTEGTDYTLTTVVVTGQVSAGGDWRAIDIFFAPSAAIQPGDSLHITKEIFEVFDNGKIWEQGEAAVLAQYPTVPEPASVALALAGGACVALSRIWRRRRRHN